MAMLQHTGSLRSMGFNNCEQSVLAVKEGEDISSASSVRYYYQTYVRCSHRTQLRLSAAGRSFARASAGQAVCKRQYYRE